MKRGELYRVFKPSPGDPKRYRVFVVVSRNRLIVSNFPTVICAPIYSVHQDLATQVPVGVVEGLKHESSIHRDELMSLPKSALTNYVGSLSRQKLIDLNQALQFAVGLTESLE